jgi:hypothetical protein
MHHVKYPLISRKFKKSVSSVKRWMGDLAEYSAFRWKSVCCLRVLGILEKEPDADVVFNGIAV